MSDPHSATQIALYGVPLPLWLTMLATIVSAVTAMIVVWRSNANSRKNLREQLAHDSRQLDRRLAYEADQRDRERNMSLRREVFLEAAAALIRMQAILGQTANIERDNSSVLDSFIKEQAILAKTHIVASENTIAAVMKYMATYGPAFIELTVLRLPITRLQSQIDLHTRLLEQATAERQRFLGMMKDHNLQVPPADPKKYDAIKAQWQISHDEAASLDATRQQLLKEQLALKMAAAERGIVLSQLCAKYLPQAVLSVRTEMEIALDSDFYEGLWQEQIQGANAAWERAKKDLSDMMRDSGTKCVDS